MFKKNKLNYVHMQIRSAYSDDISVCTIVGVCSKCKIFTLSMYVDAHWCHLTGKCKVFESVLNKN